METRQSERRDVATGGGGGGDWSLDPSLFYNANYLIIIRVGG